MKIFRVKFTESQAKSLEAIAAKMKIPQSEVIRMGVAFMAEQNHVEFEMPPMIPGRKKKGASAD